MKRPHYVHDRRMDIKHRLLKQIRTAIERASKADYDAWFKINRFVWARLQLDERKRKRIIKKALFGRRDVCGHCGEAFSSRSNIDLHRIDPSKGYVQGNCVLLHPSPCHRQVERDARRGAAIKTIRKVSKRHSGKKVYGKEYIYWWDIVPGAAHENLLKAGGRYLLIEKDTQKDRHVTASVMRKCLTSERRTTRGKGNWGVRVLSEHPGSLVLEPTRESKGWLPLRWFS